MASAAGVTLAMTSGGVIVVVGMVLVALFVPSFWFFRASRSAQDTPVAGEARPGSPAPESGEDRPGHPAQ